MAKRSRPTESVYGIMMGLKQKGKRAPSQLYPKEFTRFEAAAIGVMTVHWAYMEPMLLIATLQLAEEGGIGPPDEATAVSFERRIDAFRSTIKAVLGDTKRRRLLIALATKISNVHNDRNMVTHGLWEWYPSKPTKLRVYTFRPPFKFDTNFDLGRLAKLCDRLGQINHELSFPSRSGLRAPAFESSYWSRELMTLGNTG
jgi:hypothetical protein